ncbi:MAG: hypothetical protein IKC80_00380 [Kiritimatiellae bacterium]|nr:hypothetical protein [Kiritimatiellia bacterium]
MASEETVREWEDKAARQKRLNKAEAEYIVNDTAAARSQAKEQAENDRQRDIASSAHERAMQRRREFIERNPFAVSPFERKAVLGDHQARQDQAELRQHEIDMVNEKNRGAIGVAAKNAEGMANQGVRAAEINAGVREREIDAGLKKHELEMATNKDIAKIQSNTQTDIAAGNNLTTLKTAELQGKTQKEIAELQGKTQESIAGKQADATVNAAGITAKSAAETRLADAAARRAEREQSAFEGYMARLIESSPKNQLPPEWANLTPEQRKAKWRQIMGR